MRESGRRGLARRTRSDARCADVFVHVRIKGRSLTINNNRLRSAFQTNNRRCTMRASVAPSRQSQLLGSVASAAAAARLVEKKKEFESIQALEKASAQFLKRMEALGNDFDVMADAGTGE